jgi:aminodeoxyfutalosine synthase
MARRAVTGERVTYGRVLLVTAGQAIGPVTDAGEVRLTGAAESIDIARRRVREARGQVGHAVLTGFSLANLLELSGSDHLALAELAAALRADGLEAIAEAPLDGLGDTDNAVEVIRAVQHGGLPVWRATIASAALANRLDLIDRAVTIQRETQAFKAFAPLPTLDPADAPATGYDDVRTIAAARLMCRSIACIQVDWPLYGPKLAQVAIAYGANDIDGVAANAPQDLGPRRSPREEIERQIRAAFAEPAERNGRYESRKSPGERLTSPGDRPQS